MRQGRSQSRRFFFGLILLVTIAILSFSSTPFARAEDASEAVVEATGDVDVHTDQEPAAADETTEEESGEADVVADSEAAAEEVEVEEETNIVSEVTESAKSKLTEIVEKVKEISPQQKKKIAAGAIGLWGIAAGVGWVLNNLGGSDE